MCGSLSQTTSCISSSSSSRQQQQPEQQQNDTKSYLSSYMDAALSSLRLSVQLKELRIRVISSHSSDNTNRNESFDDDWLELRAQSVSYRDVLMGPQSEAGGGGAMTAMAPTGTTTVTTASVGEQQQQDYRTALHKVIEWTRLTVLTGGSINDSSSSTDLNVQTVALLEGTSRATLRVIEYGSSNSSSDSQDESSSSSSSSSSSKQQEQLAVRTQNDILVSMLDQKLNVSVDATSLWCIRRIAHSFRGQQQKQEQPNDDGADAAAERIQPSTPTAQP